MNFFLWLIDREIEKELEKNLRIAFINGFCFISPKTISLRRNKTHEMLSKNFVPSQKTSDDRCCQFLFLFLPFLPFLEGRRPELFI